MKKILIFGNSGSGKSTLARHIAHRDACAHLDLDLLAWLPESPPKRMPIAESWQQIKAFTDQNGSWVIEGCYTDLLTLLAAQATEIIYMDLPVAQCVANARRRPWEPHKYPSKAAQDENLAMLIEWIQNYTTRDDSFSQSAHRSFFERFTGRKLTYTENPMLG